jgi:chlorite dismutase
MKFVVEVMMSPKSASLSIHPKRVIYLSTRSPKHGAWYRLSPQSAQGMMDEHITIGKKYPCDPIEYHL